MSDLLKFKCCMGIGIFRVTKDLRHSLKIPSFSVKNLCAETKSVLTEAHVYKTSFSHSHIGKEPFATDMKIVSAIKYQA